MSLPEKGFAVLFQSSRLCSDNGDLLAIVKKLAGLHNAVALTENA